MTKIGVVIGRFQPAHLGHTSLFQRALDENNQNAYVVLVKGIETGGDLSRNPLNTSTQEAQIQYLVPNINVMESSAGSLPEIIYEILEPANALYPGEDVFHFTFYCGTDRYAGYKKQADTPEYMRDVIDDLEEDYDYHIDSITASVELVEREQSTPFAEEEIDYNNKPDSREIAMYSATLARDAIVSDNDRLAKRMMGNPPDFLYDKIKAQIKKGAQAKAVYEKVEYFTRRIR
jgi:hypothetical protein